MLNVQEQLNLLQLCVNAHEGLLGVPKPLSKNEKVYHIREGSFQVEYVTSMLGNDFYLCYEGTNSFSDWVSDFLIGKKEFYNRRVHAGFLHQYQIASKQVLPKILEKYEKKKRIILGGHSLGAALSVLTAFELSKKYKIDCELFLLACPKVGNNDFAKNFNKLFPDLKRILNKNDIIDTMPPSFFGYAHVGEKIQLGKRTYGLSFEDHSPIKYLENFIKYYL